MKLNRPILLTVALLCAMVAAGWVIWNDDSRPFMLPPRAPTFESVGLSLYAHEQWSDLYAHADRALVGDYDGDIAPDPRRVMLVRAWAAERLMDAGEIEGREPPRGCWARLKLLTDAEATARGPLEGKAIVDAVYRGWAERGLGNEDEAQRLWRLARHAQRLAVDEADKPNAIELLRLAELQSLTGDPMLAIETLAGATANGLTLASGFDSARGASVTPALADAREAAPARFGVVLLDRLRSTELRQMLADGDDESALWACEIAARHGTPVDFETPLFYAILLDRADGEATEPRTEEAWARVLRNSLRRRGAPPPPESFEKLLAAVPKASSLNNTTRCHEIGWSLRGLGYSDRARAYFERYVEIYHGQIESGSIDMNNHYNLACGLALSGQADESLEALRIAASVDRYRDIRWAVADPDLETLRRADIVEALTPPEESPAESVEESAAESVEK